LQAPLHFASFSQEKYGAQSKQQHHPEMHHPDMIIAPNISKEID
jgi:hypothetical protein